MGSRHATGSNWANTASSRGEGVSVGGGPPSSSVSVTTDVPASIDATLAVAVARPAADDRVAEPLELVASERGARPAGLGGERGDDGELGLVGA